ncbi:13795_t:CDS:2, partial [Acaulospora colombiana]
MEVITPELVDHIGLLLLVSSKSLVKQICGQYVSFKPTLVMPPLISAETITPGNHAYVRDTCEKTNTQLTRSYHSILPKFCLTYHLNLCAIDNFDHVTMKMQFWTSLNSVQKELFGNLFT